jgi:CHAD domain-containing protein
MEFSQVVHTVLRETFLQFSANLNTLRSSDAPEVLHQARVGWRRFKSALHLFRQLEASSSFPALAALKPLLQQLAALRDLEVAASEVFPSIAAPYQDGDLQRKQQWQQLETALAQTIQTQRSTLRQTLADPTVGHTLLQITRWLELGRVHLPANSHKADKPANRKWIKQRVAHVAEQLQAMPLDPKDPVKLHRMRILSKRLRYSVESLRDLLPKRRGTHWLETAIQHQTDIGQERDRQQALATAQRLHAAEGIVEFLRGAVFGAHAAAR